MFHVELRQFPHVARIFNLERGEVEARFVRPWVTGELIDHDDRRWAPDRVRLKILEGPRLRPDELGMGRGWANAAKASSDVTDALLAAARRGAEARPEVESLKSAISEVAGQAISFQDVVALAAAAHPAWRASEQLALAEQTVWEMLHQHTLTMTAAGEPVPREQWQALLLSWETWTGDGQRVALRLPAVAEP